MSFFQSVKMNTIKIKKDLQECMMHSRVICLWIGGLLFSRNIHPLCWKQPFLLAEEHIQIQACVTENFIFILYQKFKAHFSFILSYVLW